MVKAEVRPPLVYGYKHKYSEGALTYAFDKTEVVGLPLAPMTPVLSL